MRALLFEAARRAIHDTTLLHRTSLTRQPRENVERLTMSKRVMASPFLRFGSFLLVAVLSLLVSEAEAGQRNAPSIIYWSIRQVRLLVLRKRYTKCPTPYFRQAQGRIPF